MTSYRRINENQVSNIVKQACPNSAMARVPYGWLGKKVIITLAEEIKENPQAGKGSGTK